MFHMMMWNSIAIMGMLMSMMKRRLQVTNNSLCKSFLFLTELIDLNLKIIDSLIQGFMHMFVSNHFRFFLLFSLIKHIKVH